MIKVGILGGGQLGRMLLQSAANYQVETWVMEKDPNAPAAHLCHHFIQGDINSFDDVYRFGKQVDKLTIEIEHVNLEALEQLEAEGLTIIPKPHALRTLKNKILQKAYYKEHQIPTSDFIITQSLQVLKNNLHFLPAVHKLAIGGYDGKGVQVLRKPADANLGFDQPAVLEKLIPIHQEIAIIIAVSESGKSAIYPPVDMVFDPSFNLLSYQICPAKLEEAVLWKIEAIAMTAVKHLNSPGLFAVELFTDKEGNVFINEIAPRVHNSGHHSIEGNYCSQFDMLWRILLGLPLGNTEIIMPSALVNLVGENGHTGKVKYEGLSDVLTMDNVFVHLYGKQNTQPGRKMGHCTVISTDEQELLYKANKIRHTLKAKAWEA